MVTKKEGIKLMTCVNGIIQRLQLGTCIMMFDASQCIIFVIKVLG